jgi:hypothetical protein
MKFCAIGCCALLMAPFLGAGQDSRNASATDQERPVLNGTWLEGTIGPDTAIRMFLESCSLREDVVLWGVYYETKDGAPIPLQGDWLSSSTIRMNMGTSIDVASPRFDLNISGQSAVTGTYTAGDGQPVLPVRLRRVAQPAAYEVAIRKNPQRFADPRWPIEFAYPAGWLLQVTDTELVLRSPDPKGMLDDTVLECSRGSGLPSVPGVGEDPVHFQGGFYRTRTGWVVQETQVSDFLPPKTRRVGSTMLMSAEMYNGAYGPWGNLGLAAYTQYLAIDGTEWAHCSDRLLDSEQRIQPRALSRRSPR